MWKKLNKGLEKLDNSEWFRSYSYALFFGVLFIFLVAVVQQSDSSGSGLTGFVVKEAKPIYVTGNEVEYKIVSSSCEITPDKITVAEGDVVSIDFTHYDPDPRLYILRIEGYDVEVGVIDRELRTAKFLADKKGTFDINLKQPCGERVGVLEVV